jgi:hypothetical protein
MRFHDVFNETRERINFVLVRIRNLIYFRLGKSTVWGHEKSSANYKLEKVTEGQEEVHTEESHIPFPLQVQYDDKNMNIMVRARIMHGIYIYINK